MEDNYLVREVRELDEETRRCMRAAACVPSFTSAVELLIRNSVSAQSRSIDITLDLHNNGFMVLDDGEGVTEQDLRDHLGNWNRTSSVSGAQGQTLASLRCFSNVAVVTRTRASARVFEKTMDASSEEFHALNVAQGDEGRIPLHLRVHGGHGTAVWVEDLFRNLPVRKRVFRPDSTLTAMKEFVSAMSLLHHSVSWTLRTGVSAIESPRGRTAASRVVLQLPAQVSVTQRLLQLFRPAIAQSLQVVQGSAGPFLVSGLLSPPLTECCSASAHKECQLTFLNGRWLRNCTLLSAPLNELYAGIFAALSEQGTGSAAGAGQQQRKRNTGGMTGRHACAHLLGEAAAETKSGSRVALFPHFVLQICSASSGVCCEVHEEEEEAGVMALVREDRLLREALVNIVWCLLGELYPQLGQPELRYLLGQPTEGALAAGPDRLGATASAGQLATEVDVYEHLPAGHCTEKQSFTTQSPLFQSAFFSGRTTPVSCAPPAAADARQPLCSLASPCSALREIRAAVQTPTPHSSPQRQRLRNKRAREEALRGMVVDAVDGGGDGELWCSSWDTRRQRLDFTAEDRDTADSPLLRSSPSVLSPVEHTALQPSPVLAPPTQPQARVIVQPAPRNVDNSCNNNYSMAGLMGERAEEVVEMEHKGGSSSASSCSSQLVAEDILRAGDVSAPAAFSAHSTVSEGSASVFEQYKHLSTETDTDPSESATTHLRYTRHRHKQQQPSSKRRDSPEKAPTTRKIISFPPVSAVQRSLTLSKAALSEHLRCLAQVECRYLLAGTCICRDKTGEAPFPAGQQSATACGRCGDTSLLLLFDQHAVDERLRYEALSTAVCDRGEHLHQASVSAVLVMRPELMDVLEQRAGLLQRWKFDFVFAKDRAISPYFASSSSTSSDTVTLVQVPVVLGEPLQPQDLVEFAELLAATAASVPDSALAPPAIQRIVSSKACRGAVKFGDPLSQEQCARLLTALMRDTQLPFQCAHGRPSVAPLVSIQDLRDSKARAIAGKHSARSQFCWEALSATMWVSA